MIKLFSCNTHFPMVIVAGDLNLVDIMWMDGHEWNPTSGIKITPSSWIHQMTAMAWTRFEAITWWANKERSPFGSCLVYTSWYYMWYYCSLRNVWLWGCYLLNKTCYIVICNIFTPQAQIKGSNCGTYILMYHSLLWYIIDVPTTPVVGTNSYTIPS